MNVKAFLTAVALGALVTIATVSVVNRIPRLRDFVYGVKRQAQSNIV